MNKIIRISSIPREDYPNSGLLNSFFNDENEDQIWAIPSKSKPILNQSNIKLSILETLKIVNVLPIRLTRIMFIFELLLKMIVIKKTSYCIHSFIFSIPAFICGKKFAIFFHGTDSRYLKRSIFQIVVRRSIGSFGIGFGGMFGKAKIIKIENLISKTIVKPLKNKKASLVFVLRNQKVKNPYYPIYLAEELIKKFNISYNVIGVSEKELPNNERKRYLELQTRGVDIQYLGRKEYENVLNIINESSILVVPSFSEGIPKVVIESMSLGLSVLINENLKLPELLEKSCAKFSLNNFNQISNLVEVLIKKNYNESNVSNSKIYLKKSYSELNSLNAKLRTQLS